MPDRPLDEIGLGQTPRAVIYLISLLPFVGLVIGLSYAARRNVATRKFGRQLLSVSLILHLCYLFCVCPVSLYLAASN